MLSEELINYVNSNVPLGGQWWREENKQKFHQACGTMLSAGLEVDTIKEILKDLYYAVANEYEV